MRELKGKSIVALPSDYVVIDTETTGLDYEFCDIIEVCAIRYSHGQPLDTFTSLIQPRPFMTEDEDTGKFVTEYVDGFISDLTGITNEMLETAPKPAEIIPSFVSFVGNSVLIGHNVNFDVNFLYDAAERLGLTLSNNFIDTLRISRKIFPDLPHHRLHDIAYACHVEPTGEHRAKADCLTTAQCYEAMRKLVLAQQSECSFCNLFKSTYNYNTVLSNLTATVDAIDETNPLFGKFVVFTGALSSMARKNAFQIVLNLGGKPENGITKHTNFLVVGNAEFAASVKDGKTLKMRKAETYRQKGQDISVISENAFFNMIEDFLSSIPAPEATCPNSQETNALHAVADEASVFEILKAALTDVIEKNNVAVDKLIFKKGKSYASVWYDTQMAFRICCHDDRHYFGLSDTYASIADPKFIQHITTDGRSEGYTNFSFNPTENGILFYCPLLSAALDAAIDAFPKEFDCCSRYEECSNAMKCTNPRPSIATGCGYRKIMKSGRIFYGKNRNVT